VPGEFRWQPGAVTAAVQQGRWVLVEDVDRAPFEVLAALGSLLLALSGCGSGAPADSQKLNVSATTTQVADIVREVGGSAVSVGQILTPNSEAHDYEPRPSDVASVADSKLLFISGLGLDSWADKLIEQSGSSARIWSILAVRNALTLGFSCRARRGRTV